MKKIKINETDILRVLEETVMTKPNRDKFSDGFKGALRVATYINNYTDSSTWRAFVEKVDLDGFDDMIEYYMHDYINRPYSKVFKEDIGNITNFNYMDSILRPILKKMAYEDVQNFYDYLELSKTLKKHFKRLVIGD